MSDGDDPIACPACGGSGGGPFGRPGSAWDVETYECPRCKGSGLIAPSEPVLARPLAKSNAKPAKPAVKSRGLASTKPAPAKRKKVTSGRGK